MEAQSCERLASKAVQQNLSVLLDARKYGHGGIGTYLENLVNGLIDAGISRIGLVAALESSLPSHWSQSCEIFYEKARPYSVQEILKMGSRLPVEEFDLFHTPHYVLPIGIKIPSVITVHDLIHITHPHSWYYPYVAKHLIKSAVNRASMVLTVSDASRRELIKYAEMDSESQNKLRVIPNSFEPRLSQISDLDRRLFKLTGVGEKYFLSVISQARPHKGLNALISAYESAAKETEMPELVVAGKGIERKGRKGRILFLGEISDQLLYALYRNSRGVVVASSAEGFCLPVLEAHAAGVPVLARPVPAIHELLGAGDHVCADFSVRALRKGLVEFARTLEKNPAKTKSRVNLNRFSRENVTEQVCQAYCEVIGA